MWAIVAAALTLAFVGGCGGGEPRRVASTAAPRRPAPTRAQQTGARQPPGPPYAVGLRVVRIVDPTRTISLPGGRRMRRTLVTYLRYPARSRAPAAGGDAVNAASAPGRFPLVVFGHGFQQTPAIYAALLRAWARAGYVVAAPVFPLENANAPGGPDESDLVNQPADMSDVISVLTGAGSPFGALVDARRVAVAGHSDGGETALAVAYDRFYHDDRVGAAMILSGAKIPGVSGFTFPSPSPPLLATQGTADAINPPSFTAAFYDQAPGPKYLLTLPGAGHLPPYTGEQPQLGVVERVTVAFLDLYLKREDGAAGRLEAAGTVAGVATLTHG